ncbi:hypothetical protein THAOC_23575, partial [Thalassiosira oceanica]
TGRRVDRLQQGLAARAVGGAVLVVDDKVAVAGRGEELGDHRAVGHADGAVGLGPRQEAPAQGQRRRGRDHSEGNQKSEFHVQATSYSTMETKGSKKRRLDEEPSANNGGVVTMEDVQRLIDKRVLQVEQATQREQASMRRQVDALEEANAALKIEVVGLKLETEDLRRRCAVNARSIQVLKKDVKWTYSAPDIPPQPLAESGPRRPVHRRDDEDYAIQLRGEGVLLTFSRFKVQVNRSVKDMLSQSLVLKCDQVGFYRNRFNDQDGIDFAVEVIQNNPQLNVFGFENAIENEESADRLCRSILEHPNIQRLGLISCCNEGDTFGYSMLKTLVSSPARKLNLRGNHIRTNGCSILPDYIASNPPLTHLCLGYNHLVDDDLRMISMALKTNIKLKELHLKRNDYTAIGIKWLEVAVRGLRPVQTGSGSSFLDPSFESVFDCNHTCRIYGDPESVFKELNCSSPLENKLRKLYDLIVMHSLRGDIVNELQRAVGGDLISLMPFVLQRIEAIHLRLGTSFPSIPLSILLGLLRDMPELLENQTKII